MLYSASHAGESPTNEIEYRGTVLIQLAVSDLDESVRFSRPPSQQLTEQMGFTPYPYEDVARLVTESNEHLYLFSSDYPHVEGGRDPIAKFDHCLRAESEAVKERFYSENFLRIWPEARVG